ncbi:MAG: alpha-L-rhamnosidase [Planctomycetes bacterium]|nr:alpha-L-rhamnosidase [Planctomycetota bacterium]
MLAIAALLASSLAAALPQDPASDRTAVVREDVAPVRVERLGAGHLFVDFGRAGFGNLRLELGDVEPGRRIVVHLGEQRRGDAVEREPGGTVRYQRAEVVTESGRRSYRPALRWSAPGWLKAGFVAMPDYTGEVAPFRYAELENLPSHVGADQLVQEVWHVPYDADAAAFESSEPVLDEVWELCRHSVIATSFAGLYVDGDRERRPYEADALINALSHYAVDAHYETARHTWRYLLEHPTWPTEWILQAPLLAWNDLLWSGDAAAVEAHYDALVARALIDRRLDDGLLRGQNRGEPRDIVDWPAGERDGYDMAPAVKTVVSAFHAEALRCLARIGGQLGRTDDAARFDRLADQTVAAISARLWDEQAGRYVDGLDPETGVRSAHASLHASMFLLAFGMVPDERVPRVVEFVASRGMACSVYGAQFLIDGLYRAGAAEAALALLTATGERSWAHMSRDLGSTITLEAWDPRFKPNLDWNHAWGAAPANLLVRGLLGMEPLEPGFVRFRVRPQLATLQHARVRTPTPRGAIELAVRQPGDGAWTASLVVPPGTRAELCVPAADPSDVAHAGDAPVRVVGRRGATIVLEVGAGRVEVSARRGG